MHAQSKYLKLLYTELDRRARGWDHLESTAVFLISQEMKLEIARLNQTDEVPVELLLDQEALSTELAQEE